MKLGYKRGSENEVSRYKIGPFLIRASKLDPKLTNDKVVAGKVQQVSPLITAKIRFNDYNEIMKQAILI